MLKIISHILFWWNKKLRKKFLLYYSPWEKTTRKWKKLGIIGEHTGIMPGVTIRDKRTRIGKFCAIARNVSIGTGIHPLNYLTIRSFTYKPAGYWTIPEENRVHFENHKPVTIGNDVWIGMNAIIMDGINIGDGAVIGAGAVVTRDVPPFAVAVGVPARVIKYRFDGETIKRITALQWWDFPDEILKSLPWNDLEKCLEVLENLKDKHTVGKMGAQSPQRITE
jgi:acetyltransferase-like isoleucine patch superfamily enzyme